MFFGAGRSFKIYGARSEKARLLLRAGASWKTKAVAAAGYGLTEAGALEGPALRASDVDRWRGPFLLRIPPGCLLLPRQQAGGDLDSETRLASRAVIGLSGAKLVIRLKEGRRKAPDLGWPESASARNTRGGPFSSTFRICYGRPGPGERRRASPFFRAGPGRRC